MTAVLIPALVLGGIGLLLGLIIGIAVFFFAVKADDRMEKITELLPGANCGGCGFAGCSDFAGALADGKAEPSGCVACSADQVKAIGAILGKNVELREKMVAVVYCSGDRSHAARSAEYNGLNDCRAAAALSGGGKGCRFGCIGLATCARNCPFGAIELRNGLAVVHPELCTGCGKCVELCPRKLIHLVPASSKAHIYCNSLEKGAVKSKRCSAGCIGCKKCVRTAPDLFLATGGLVRVISPEKVDKELVEKIACPKHVLHLVDLMPPSCACEQAEESKETK